MAATVIVELKHGENADGTRSVRLRITKDRLKAYYNTGIKVRYDKNPRKSEWNPDPDYRKNNFVTSRHPQNATLNANIRIALDGLDAVSQKHPTFTAQQVKDRYEQGEQSGEQAQGLVPFMEELRDRFSANGREAYAEQLKYTLRVLREYTSKTTDEHILTPSFLAGFHAWLKSRKRKLSDERKYKPKTIKIFFNALSNAYKMGLSEGRVLQAGNPFAGLDLFVPPSKQRRPNADIFASLLALDLSGKESLFHARNAFLLFFYLHGGRVSEIIQLAWEHITDTHVSYLPSKKGARWKTVPRNAMINQLLDYYPRTGKYVLPYLPDHADKLPENEFYYVKKDAKDTINTNLKSLSRQLGIPTLTCHMARRTFTDAALKALKDTRAVQHLGGWASVAMVEKYADEIQQEETDIASGLIFGLEQGEQ